MPAHRIASDPQAQKQCVARIGYPEHQGIADRLDVLAVETRKLHLNCAGELLHEPHGMLVSVRFRKRREAGDVREQEGGFGVL